MKPTLDEQIEWVREVLCATKDQYAIRHAILATLRSKQAEPVTEGVSVTLNEQGQTVAVTRIDEDHRILSVIWEAPQPVAAPGREG